jgi:hypothetical protein
MKMRIKKMIMKIKTSLMMNMKQFTELIMNFKNHSKIKYKNQKEIKAGDF